MEASAKGSASASSRASGHVSPSDDTRETDSAPSLAAKVDASPLFTPGARIEHYEIIREIGRGGMGVVYLARDEQLGRLVAIKALRARQGEDSLRFVQEARVTARCTHENIVIIHAVSSSDGVPYMVLEHLEGVTLASLLDEHRVSAERAVQWMIPVVRALVKAHSMDIVHRDLKPSNVFITRSGVVKVLDFGISRMIGTSAGESERRSRLDVERTGGGRGGTTVQDMVSGTARYMSPEQWTGAEPDARNDIWAVGVMLHLLVTGETPTGSMDNAQIEAWACDLDSAVPSIGTLVGGLPEPFVRLVDRCLRKRAEERPYSAEELLSELESLAPSRSSSDLNPQECPFPGLVSFRGTDADRYFGREAEVRRAVSLLQERPIVAIAGPSGRGKSSFAMAGVLPQLRASGEAYDVVTIRPGKDPFAALVSTCNRGIFDATGTASLDDLPVITSPESLRDKPGVIGRFLRAHAAHRRSRIVVYVDQFEELFTLVADSEEQRRFMDCLLAIGDDVTSSLRLVLSVRSDFIDRFAEHQRFADEVTRGLLLLPEMSRAALRRALVRPAEMVGYRFEDDEIVESMLGELEGTAGALSLLQFAAARLWEARDEKRKLLTRESYDSMGGIAGTLAAHADATLGGLNRAEQRLARRIVLRLVTPERTRALVDRAELLTLGDDPRAAENVIDHLVASRLLAVDGRMDAEDTMVELVHESLIERWPALRRWLEESADDAVFRAQLREVARQWERKGEPAGLLWRGEAAEEARRFMAREPDDLPERERRYLREAVALAERSSRLRRWLVAGAFVVSVAVAVGASVGLVQIRSAEQVALSLEKDARASAAAANQQAVAAKKEAQRAQAAEQKVQEQLELLQSEEKARRAAEDKASNASENLEETNAELERSNEKLAEAAKQARKAAEQAAEATEAEKKLRKQLQGLLDKERQRVRELEKQRGKIITDLE